jgi:hypothetical protein
VATKEIDVADFGSTSLPDSDGQERTLADYWRDQPVVFVWLRHYG